MTEKSSDGPDVAAELAAGLGGVTAVKGILDIICRSTGIGYAAVSTIRDDRWIACVVRDDAGFGLSPGTALPIETTLCGVAARSGDPILIDDVETDPVFADHAIPKAFGLRSYVSFPIVRSNGEVFGTLCALDTRPNFVSSVETREMFRRFAELIAYHVDAVDRAEHSEASLARERETAILRDQFIAVLGHDLRNPVAAVEAGINLLSRSDLSSRDRLVVSQMKTTTDRIVGLIDDVLDFARGHLGDGLHLKVRGDQHLRPVIEQVIDELRQANPDRKILSTICLDGRVEGDPQRIGQLLSNFLGNAIFHGAVDKDVEVRAEMRDGSFVLSVCNGGNPIPPEAMATLFKPFTRGVQHKGGGGLGLGLYICALIADAHEGTLHVQSDESGTCFEFRKPLAVTGT
ncbi:GAF domain-containing sensor histidine kinase [Brevundimonas variabilis]|uniref:GAF domain-containing sensor histidine kinase n=1 Tax=Brevundimonas variabilis TaxID=74312 RepID=UPI001606E920|nr:GAF domain-containing sensor histidine kinase [Brevundimonas variabilis]